MASFAAMKNLDVWYAHLDIEDALKEFGSQFKAKQVKRTEKRSPRPAPRTACRPSPNSPRGGRRGADRRRTAVIVPIDDLAEGVTR